MAVAILQFIQSPKKVLEHYLISSRYDNAANLVALYLIDEITAAILVLLSTNLQTANSELKFNFREEQKSAS